MVLVPGIAQHPSGPFIHQLLFVVNQDPGDLKGVADVALPYKMRGADNGRATRPLILGQGQFVQNTRGLSARYRPTT